MEKVKKKIKKLKNKFKFSKVKQVLKDPKVISYLRYYATFKVRKFESLFFKINTYLHKTTTFIGLQVFFDFGRSFGSSFSVLFSEAPASCDKVILE